jgi:phage terminase Nu1 subunit (DNA packaging protein)
MPRDENPKNFSALTVMDVSALLFVTDRAIRKWIKMRGLPAKEDGRGYVLDWRAVLAWYVKDQAEECGTGGTAKTDPAEPEEDYKDALARKTRAEADLMELKLARERGQVAAITDVEKVLAHANTSIRTLIQAWPAQMAPQLIGLDDRAAAFAILRRECDQLLTNMATIDAILEAGDNARDKSE